MRDSAEFDAFYAATGALIVDQVYLMIGDRDAAQTAVAEAFARAWQRWGTVCADGHPASWVRGTAYRIATNSWRRATSRRSPDPATTAFAGVLRRLPAAQRRDVVLHHFAGLTVDEIAAETGSSPQRVSARLLRGQAALADVLNDLRENVDAK